MDELVRNGEIIGYLIQEYEICRHTKLLKYIDCERRHLFLSFMRKILVGTLETSLYCNL